MKTAVVALCVAGVVVAALLSEQPRYANEHKEVRPPPKPVPPMLGTAWGIKKEVSLTMPILRLAEQKTERTWCPWCPQHTLIAPASVLLHTE